MGADRPGRRAQGRRRGHRLTERRICRVQPDVPAVHRAFDYAVPDALAGGVALGTIVRVPLHGRTVRGWVLDADVRRPETAPERVRDVLGLVSAGPPGDVVDLCRWAAWRWAGPVVAFLRAASPVNRVLPVGEPERESAVYPGSVGPEHPWWDRPVIVVAPRDGPAVQLLVASEGSTIVVDPSPRRSATLAAALRDEGRDVAAFNSGDPASQRTREWDRARAGACVVVGGRTAVWAPVPDLRAVVVVDDADEALEDERAPTWNARDVALERARRTDAAVHFVSPAPTVDVLVALDQPVRPSEGASTPRPRWPRVEVVDLRDEAPGRSMLSGALADALHRTVDRGERGVCVLNRTGRARLLACNTCRELARCERCDAAVAQVDTGFLCAQCATSRPEVCLHCHGSSFRILRPGIGRVRDELAALLPRITVVAVDPHTDAGELQRGAVVIGTEAALHRLDPHGGPPVGLVAYLELDQELLAPRARAAEQALWLLVRGARLLGPGPSSLLMQTRLPGHEVVRAVVESEPLLVAAAEHSRRRALGFPPFGGLAELSGASAAVVAACDALRRQPGITVLGPVDRAGGSHALVKAPSPAELCDALAGAELPAARAFGRLRVDVDPRRV